MQSLKLKLFGLISLLVVGLAAVPQVQAATPTSGITVSPAQMSILLNGPADQSTAIIITNNYSVPVSLSAEFKGIDENSGRLIPTDALDDSLTDNLHLSQTIVNLPAHASQTLSVQVTNAVNLSPGGHYATVVLTQLNRNSQLSLNAAISLNLFIIKSSGVQESLTAANLQSNGWLFQLPTSVDIDFTNSGNIHTVPRASVDLNHGDTNLAHGVANIGSLPLLPGYRITTTADLVKLHTSWLPGRYQLAVTYRADGSTTTHTVNHSYWYIPPIDVLILLVLLFLIYKILRNWRQLKKWLHVFRRHKKPSNSVLDSSLNNSEATAISSGSVTKPIESSLHVSKMIFVDSDTSSENEVIAVTTKSLSKPKTKAKKIRPQSVNEA